MSTEFVTTCRHQVIGRCDRLEEALQHVGQWVREDWLDLAIWWGNELVAVVQAGGNVVHLTGETWRPEAPEDTDAVLIDLDALQDHFEETSP